MAYSLFITLAPLLDNTASADMDILESNMVSVSSPFFFFPLNVIYNIVIDGFFGFIIPSYEFFYTLDLPLKFGFFENFLYIGGIKINSWLDYLYPAAISNINSPLSVVNPTQISIATPPVDPHYGHHPLDHRYWKEVAENMIKAPEGCRKMFRLEIFYNSMVMGYIDKRALLNPDLIASLPHYDIHCTFRGVPYDKIEIRGLTPRNYAYQPIGSVDVRRLDDPSYTPGQNRDIIRLYGMDSSYWNFKFLWLETELPLLEQKIVEYVPRLRQNHLIYPDRASPFFVSIVRFCIKLAIIHKEEYNFILDGDALTNWKENEEYFKYFCENIVEKYYMSARYETEEMMNPPRHKWPDVPKGYKCW